MGNRALIKQKGSDLCVYLHWNGGRDSVEPFLKYCELRGFRPFSDPYGIARFCQVVGNFFGGSLSIGVELEKSNNPDWLDNGIYIVDGWEIVQRIPEDIEEQNAYDPLQVLVDVDNCQPESERLGAEFFLSKPIDVEDVQEGDTIYVFDPLEVWTKTTARKGTPAWSDEQMMGYNDKFGFVAYRKSKLRKAR